MIKRLISAALLIATCVIGAWLMLSQPEGMPTPVSAVALDTPPEPQWGVDVQVNPPVTSSLPTQKNFSFAVNPTNPDNVIAGYDNTASSNSLSGYSWSTDGGHTWQGGRFEGPWQGTEPMTPLGDANVAFDARGVGYYTSLAIGANSSGHFVLTTTNGSDWSAPLPVAINDNSLYHAQSDLAVDPRMVGTNAGRAYVFWLETANVEPSTHGIKMRYSRNGGVTWSSDVQVSDDGHQFSYSPWSTVASNGWIYVAFSEVDNWLITNPPKLFLDRSTDGGVTWGIDNLITGAVISPAGRPDFKFRELTLIGAANCGLLRIHHFPAIAVSPADPNTVYAVWNDGRWESQTSLCGYQGRHSDIAFSRRQQLRDARDQLVDAGARDRRAEEHRMRK